MLKNFLLFAFHHPYRQSHCTIIIISFCLLVKWSGFFLCFRTQRELDLCLASNPGPNKYEVLDKLVHPSTCPYTSVFKSKCARNDFTKAKQVRSLGHNGCQFAKCKKSMVSVITRELCILQLMDIFGSKASVLHWRNIFYWGSVWSILSNVCSSVVVQKCLHLKHKLQNKVCLLGVTIIKGTLLL